MKVTDLGVTFDSTLILKKHVNIITHKAYKSLGFVMRFRSKFNFTKTLESPYNGLRQ